MVFPGQEYVPCGPPSYRCFPIATGKMLNYVRKRQIPLQRTLRTSENLIWELKKLTSGCGLLMLCLQDLSHDNNGMLPECDNAILMNTGEKLGE